ncbi:MAG: Aspartate kinase Ask_LysC [Alphaproteobacteria bacterium MarineAlpha2_Bin1]|nr:MAG: Aspartate kinase Ask_LysC [Alphaproteobacteria bacterium MarineAlpha2_Bin1]
MSRYLLKFGGTSLADINQIQNIASKIKAISDQGHELAVVVSAMAGKTNELISMVSEASIDYSPEEYDVIVSSGEQVSAGLLAISLRKIGLNSRSWLGWQIPIITEGIHSFSRIKDIDVTSINESMEREEIAVIAGFQGISLTDRISTLGRGGSDTSAVALAAALKAERCDIYTDVDGVYTSDPRIVPKAKKLNKITYEEMLEMSSLGAKVLQTRSVELAKNKKVRLQVLSSFNNVSGTMVVDEDEILEKEIVSGITYSPNEAKITVSGVSDRPGIAARIFGPLADSDINVDMIVQNISLDKKTTDLTFTITRNQLNQAINVLEKNKNDLAYEKIISNDRVVKVSVVGVGMRSHPGVAQKMFSTLGQKGINIHVISTSEIKVSVLIDEEYTELAIRSLHTAYGLDEN